MARPLPLAVQAAAKVLVNDGPYNNAEKAQGKILKWLQETNCDSDAFLPYASALDFAEMFKKADQTVLAKAFKELTDKDPEPQKAQQPTLVQNILVHTDSRDPIRKALDLHNTLNELRKETNGAVVICSEDESHLPAILEYYRNTGSLPKVCPCCHEVLVAPFGRYSGFDGNTLLSPTKQGDYINLMTGIREPADHQKRLTIYAMVNNLGFSSDVIVRNLQNGDLTAGLTPVQLAEIEGIIPQEVVYRRQDRPSPLGKLTMSASGVSPRTKQLLHDALLQGWQFYGDAVVMFLECGSNIPGRAQSGFKRATALLEWAESKWGAKAPEMVLQEMLRSGYNGSKTKDLRDHLGM